MCAISFDMQILSASGSGDGGEVRGYLMPAPATPWTMYFWAKT
jgi:hypothetical protein